MLKRAFDDAAEECDSTDFMDLLRDCDSLFPDEATARSTMASVGEHLASQPDAVQDLDIVPQLADMLMARTVPSQLQATALTSLLHALHTDGPPPEEVAAAYCNGCFRGHGWAASGADATNQLARALYKAFFPEDGHPPSVTGVPPPPLQGCLSSAVLAQAGRLLSDMQQGMLPPSELQSSLLAFLAFTPPLLPLPGVAPLLALSLPALCRLAGMMPPVLQRVFTLLKAIPEHLPISHVGIRAAHALLNTRVAMAQRQQLKEGLQCLATHAEELNCSVLAHVLIKTPLDSDLAHAALEGLAAKAGQGGLDLAQDSLGALAHAADVEERNTEHALLSTVGTWCASHHDSLVDPPPTPSTAAAAGASLLLGKALRQAVLLLAVRHASALPPAGEDTPPSFEDVWRSSQWTSLLQDLEALVLAVRPAVLALGGQGEGGQRPVQAAPLAGEGLHMPSLLAGLAVPLLPTESHRDLPRALLNDVAHALSWVGLKQDATQPAGGAGGGVGGVATDGLGEQPWTVFMRGAVAAEHMGNMNAVAMQHAMSRAASAPAAAAVLAARALSAVAFTLGAAASVPSSAAPFILHKLQMGQPPPPPHGAAEAPPTSLSTSPVSSNASDASAATAAHPGVKRPRSSSGAGDAPPPASAAPPKRSRGPGGRGGGLSGMSLSKKRRRPLPALGGGRTPSSSLPARGTTVRTPSTDGGGGSTGQRPQGDRLLFAGGSWTGLFALSIGSSSHDEYTEGCPPLTPLAAAVCLLMPQCLAVAAAISDMPKGLMPKSSTAMRVALCSASLFPLSCGAVALLSRDEDGAVACIASSYSSLGMSTGPSMPSSAGIPLDIMLLYRHACLPRLLAASLSLPPLDAEATPPCQQEAAHRCEQVMLAASALYNAPPAPLAALVEGETSQPPLSFHPWAPPAGLKPLWAVHPSPQMALSHLSDTSKHCVASTLPVALAQGEMLLPQALAADPPSALQVAAVAAALAAQLAALPPAADAALSTAETWVRRVSGVWASVPPAATLSAATRVLQGALGGGYGPLLALQLHTAIQGLHSAALNQVLHVDDGSPPPCWLLGAIAHMSQPALQALLRRVPHGAHCAWLLGAAGNDEYAQAQGSLAAAAAELCGVQATAGALARFELSLRQRAQAAGGGQAGPSVSMQTVLDAAVQLHASLISPAGGRSGQPKPADTVAQLIASAVDGDGGGVALGVLTAMLGPLVKALQQLASLRVRLPAEAASPDASTACLAALLHPAAMAAWGGGVSAPPAQLLLLCQLQHIAASGLSRSSTAALALLDLSRQDAPPLLEAMGGGPESSPSPDAKHAAECRLLTLLRRQVAVGDTLLAIAQGAAGLAQRAAAGAAAVPWRECALQWQFLATVAATEGQGGLRETAQQMQQPGPDDAVLVAASPSGAPASCALGVVASCLLRCLCAGAPTLQADAGEPVAWQVLLLSVHATMCGLRHAAHPLQVASGGVSAVAMLTGRCSEMQQIACGSTAPAPHSAEWVLSQDAISLQGLLRGTAGALLGPSPAVAGHMQQLAQLQATATEHCLAGAAPSPAKHAQPIAGSAAPRAPATDEGAAAVLPGDVAPPHPPRGAARWQPREAAAAAASWLKQCLQHGRAEPPDAALRALAAAVPPASADAAAASALGPALQQFLWEAAGQPTGLEGVPISTQQHAALHDAAMQCTALLLLLLHVHSGARAVFPVPAELSAVLGAARDMGLDTGTHIAVTAVIMLCAGMLPSSQPAAQACVAWCQRDHHLAAMEPPLIPFALALQLLPVVATTAHAHHLQWNDLPVDIAARLLVLPHSCPAAALPVLLPSLPPAAQPLRTACAAVPAAVEAHHTGHLASAVLSMSSHLDAGARLGQGGLLWLGGPGPPNTAQLGALDPLASPIQASLAPQQHSEDTTQVTTPQTAFSRLCRGGGLAALVQACAWVCASSTSALQNMPITALLPLLRAAASLLHLLAQQVTSVLAAVCCTPSPPLCADPPGTICRLASCNTYPGTRICSAQQSRSTGCPRCCFCSAARPAGVPGVCAAAAGGAVAGQPKRHLFAQGAAASVAAHRSAFGTTALLPLPAFLLPALAMHPFAGAARQCSYASATAPGVWPFTRHSSTGSPSHGHCASRVGQHFSRRQPRGGGWQCRGFCR